MSLLSADSSTTSGQVDILIGVTTLLFYITLTGFIYWMTRYRIKGITLPWKHRLDRDYESLITHSKLFDELKAVDKTNLGVLYTLIAELMHDFFLPLFLICFVKMPNIQLIFATLTTAITGWFYIRNSPYKSRFVGILKVGNKCIYFTILLAFLLGNLVEGRISKSQNFIYFGFGLIGLISILLVFNVAIMFLSTLAGLCSRWKSKKNESPEVIVPRIGQVADINIERNRVRIVEPNHSSNQSGLNLLQKEDSQEEEKLEKEQKHDKEVPLFQISSIPLNKKFGEIFSSSSAESRNLSRGSLRSHNREPSMLEQFVVQRRSIDIRRRKSRRGSRMRRRRSFHNSAQKSLNQQKQKKSIFSSPEKPGTPEGGLRRKESRIKYRKRKSRFHRENKKKEGRNSWINPNQIGQVSQPHHIEPIAD